MTRRAPVGRTRRRRARRSPRRAEQLTVLGAAVVSAVAVGWAAVRVAGDGDDTGPGEIAADPGVAHVHGLGINPADGSLVVATHYGSFRIAADRDEAERIGESFQDTMGFTVAGPDHFLGSGHPDLAGSQRGDPRRLGLIESTDAGASWTILSLGGDVDFHALAFAHDRVYGWDSGTGRFLVSANRTDWETRATLDLFGFAVDPGDADHIIGAGPDRLVESTDGGREWAGVHGPPIVALSWDADAGLWGADPGGIVWRHAGDDWERAGTLPGAPQAFLAAADALYSAVHEADDRTAIYRSTDDGRTWDLRYRDAAP
jgi:hypothetical protein